MSMAFFNNQSLEILKNFLVLFFVLFVYFIPLSALFGKRLFRQLPKIEQKFWGAITLLSSLIVWSTNCYYIYQINLASALLIALSPLITLPILRKLNTSSAVMPQKIEPATKFPWLLLVALSLDAYLLATLWLGQTTELMPSPWQVVMPSFFILYALSTIVIFLGTYRYNTSKLTYLTSCTHFLLTYSVAAILYKLGFGFDAFVHRATEDWILQYGFILPKSPYYIGQYSLVVWLSRLTSWPLHIVDIWLVPILASLLIPSAVAYTAKHFYAIPEKYGLIFSYIIPFVPFFSFQLTTPYNLALLFSFVLILACAGYLKNKVSAWFLVLLALTIVCIHALLGAPLIIFTLGIIISKNKFSVLRAVFTWCSLVLVLPILFAFNNWRVGAGLPKIINPFNHFNDFFTLFARPYWYAAHTPWKYEVLYAWQLLIVPLFIALSVFGFIILKKCHNEEWKKLLLFPLASIAMIVSAWLLRTLIVFPDVVSYEQGDYPLRLLKFSLVFLLPLVLVGLYEIILIVQNNKYRKIALPVLAIGAGTILMLSFYFSYPQRNIKARFPGYNVTISHLKAVEWIHQQEPEFNYIVLADQLTSAAALSKYSFAKYHETSNGQIFYYSIPTGGLLYQDYGHMVYEGQKKEFMEHAMEIAGVNKAYFMVNSYWANYQNIVEGAKKTANAWQEIDGGKAWVFTYNR